MNYQTIDKCRSCNGTLLYIISLGEQTSVGFTDKPEDGVKTPLDLVLCTNCYLLQLKHTTDKAILYNENYGYRSGVNETMIGELSDVVDSTDTSSEDVVIDIGCNDGTLLSNYPRDVYRVGFDPSLGTSVNTGNNLARYCQDNLSRGGAQYKIFRDYFRADLFKKVFGNRKAQVITAIAMFYDLEDPNQFLEDIRSVLDDNGIFIIQQNYLVGMLQNVAFDNVCHEHLEYYSLTSLERLLDKYGLQVVDVEEREINGGSFRTYIKKSYSQDACFTPPFVNPSVEKMRQKEKELGLDTPTPYLNFANRVQEVAGNLRHFIQNKVKEGKKVYAYGASTRGNSLLQVCKIDNKLISGAAERNPTKYGKYTAGTKIKIISEDEARSKADVMLCLPWFFFREFIQREKSYIMNGGELVFPLPKLYSVNKSNLKTYDQMSILS